MKIKDVNRTSESDPRIIGFFHPPCDAMGGGEKVLYAALNALQNEKEFDGDTILVYTSNTTP